MLAYCQILCPNCPSPVFADCQPRLPFCILEQTVYLMLRYPTFVLRSFPLDCIHLLSTGDFYIRGQARAAGFFLVSFNNTFCLFTYKFNLKTAFPSCLSGIIFTQFFLYIVVSHMIYVQLQISCIHPLKKGA